MSQLSDFEFDEAEIPGTPGAEAARAASAAVPPEAPDATPPSSAVIVVEKRSSRGLATMLAPPALILLIALVITSSQRTQPVRYLMPRQLPTPDPTPAMPPPTAPADAKIRVHAESHGEPIAPPAAPEETVTARPEEPASKPSPDPDRSPFEFDTNETPRPKPDAIVRVVPFDPVPKEGPSAKPDEAKNPGTIAAPETPPAETKMADFTKPIPEPAQPSKDDILQDIEREAREKAVIKDDMEDQKQHARVEIFEEALARVHADRTAFREDVRKALDGLGNEAAPEIERLCLKHGREPLPEVVRAYHGLLRMAPPRRTLTVEIELMRMAGYPEPLILDKITENLVKTTMGTREGPRDRNEARVLAARKLLRLPIKKTLKLPPPTRFRDAPAQASARGRVLAPAPRP